MFASLFNIILTVLLAVGLFAGIKGLNADKESIVFPLLVFPVSSTILTYFALRYFDVGFIKSIIWAIVLSLVLFIVVRRIILQGSNKYVNFGVNFVTAPIVFPSLFGKNKFTDTYKSVLSVIGLPVMKMAEFIPI